MNRPIFAGILAFTLIFINIPQTHALLQNSPIIQEKRDDIRERDKEILRLEKKKNQTKKDAQAILNRMKQQEKELNALDQKVYELEQEIELSKRKITELEKLLEEKKQTFHRRLTTIYLQGDMFYLEVLIQSPSLEDFFKRLYYVSKVNKADHRLMEEYKRYRQDLLLVQSDLQKTLQQLNDQKKNAEQVYQSLRKQWEEHQALLSLLDQDQRELEEANQKARQELDRLIAHATREAQRKEQSSNNPNHALLSNSKSSTFVWPVRGGKLSSPFGFRKHPIHGTVRKHEGIDISAPMGTPILAAARGEVIEARPASGYGYIIVIYHGNGLSTLYAHMYAQTVKVRKGDTVSAGQVIAEVGSNGWSTGPHLHFEVHQNGSPVDPMEYLR